MNPDELAKKYGGTSQSTSNADELAAKFGGSIKTTQGTTKPETDIPYFPDTIVRETGKVFLPFAASLASIGAQALAAPFGKSAEAKKTAEQGIDFPYFGRVKPIGAGFDSVINKKVEPFTDIPYFPDTALAVGKQLVTQNTRPLADAIGKGVTAASMFLPIKGVKTAMTAAGTFGAGAAAEAIGEGKSGGEAAAEGAITGAVTLGGLGLLGAGAKGFGYLATKALQNPAVKAASDRVAQYAESFKNLVTKEQRAGLAEDIDYTSKVFQREVEQEMNNLKTMTADSLKVPMPNQQKVLNDLRAARNRYITQQYKAKDDVFKSVIQDGDIIIDDFASKNAAIQRVNQEKAMLNKDGIETPNLDRYMAAITGDVSLPISGGSRFTIKGKAVNEMPLSKLWNTYSLADNFRGSASNAEDALIRELSHSLLDDATRVMQSKYPQKLETWNAARDMARQISDNVDSTFSSKLTASQKIDDFTDRVLDGKPPRREEMADFKKAFDKEEQQGLSQLMFNSIVDKSKNMLETDAAGAAKLLDDTIKSLGQFGDDNPIADVHMAQLQQLSRLFKNEYSDFVAGATEKNLGKDLVSQAKDVGAKKSQADFIKEIGDLAADKTKTSKLGDRLAKIDSAEEADVVMNVLKDNPEAKNLVGQEILRGVAERNLNSKFSEKEMIDGVNKFFSEIDKIGGSNKRAVFDTWFGDTKLNGVDTSLADYLDFIFKEKSRLGVISDVKDPNVMNLLHLFLGASHAISGNPIPAAYHISNFGKSMTGGVPMKEMKEMIDNLPVEKGKYAKTTEFLADIFNKAIKPGAIGGSQAGEKAGESMTE